MLIKIDMHVHTTHSDGLMTVRRAIDEAQRRGLQGIAVSDHNTFHGAQEALELSIRDFLIVPSAEYSTTQGHMLAFFVCKDAKDSGVFHRGGLFDFDEIRLFTGENGGMLFMAHPFRGGAPGAELIKKLSGVEIFNGRNSSKGTDWNQSAAQLCRSESLPFCAGSDAHTRGELASAYRIFDFPHDRLCSLCELADMLAEPFGQYFGRYSPYTLQGTSTLLRSFRIKAPRHAVRGAAKTAVGLFKDAAFMMKKENAELSKGCVYRI